MDKFEIIRHKKVKPGKIKIGDQLTISIKDKGTFTATCQHVDPIYKLFMFDECIEKISYNTILKLYAYNTNYKYSLFTWYLGMIDMSYFNTHAAILEYELPDIDYILSKKQLKKLLGHFEHLYPDRGVHFQSLVKSKEKRIRTYNGEPIDYFVMNNINTNRESIDIISTSGEYKQTEQTDAEFGICPIFKIADVLPEFLYV